MTVAGMLVWPGSGATRDHRTLVALEAGLAPLAVARVDHAHRLAGRRAPGKAQVDIDAVVAAVGDTAAGWGVPTNQLVIGGRSYGGRICSMAVAAGLAVAGLVLLSYPLHPPGKPDRLRVEHLADITVPTLVVSGRRDPFGSPEEFAPWLATIAGPVTEVWLGGAHDPRNDDAVVEAVRTWVDGLG
jgi:predicted alpha/beta-hydrolase family hydrolase